MKDKVISNNKYSILDAFKCYFFLVIITAVASLVYSIVLSIIASAKGISSAELTATDTVQVISFVISPVIFIIFFFCYNAKAKVKNKYALSDGNSISLLPISIAMVLAIISIFLFTPVMNFFQALFETKGYAVDNAIPMQDKMSGSLGFFLLGLIVYALLPAIAEELVFRGIIQKGLSSRYNAFTTIFLSSVMFVLMHGSLQQTLYQFVLGIMLGYLAHVGGSIIYSMILHFLNNALVVVFSCFDIVGYISGSDTIYYNIFSVIFPFMLFILGCILCGILFWVLKYLRNKNFFRLDENGKFKKVEVVEEEEKIGLKGMWKDMSYNEKIFFLSAFGLVILIWLINTIAGFM